MQIFVDSFYSFYILFCLLQKFASFFCSSEIISWKKGIYYNYFTHILVFVILVAVIFFFVVNYGL